MVDETAASKDSMWAFYSADVTEKSMVERLDSLDYWKDEMRVLWE